MQVATKSREIRLASRPSGEPTAANFELVETDMPQPGEGEVTIRNTHMSVEPYMRGRMNDAKSYVPPFQIGKALDGAAVGFVTVSNAPDVPVGTWVASQLGWREYGVAKAKELRRLASGVPPTAYLGSLGVPGFTAWVGLHDIGNLKADDVVFVSSAAGAVGSVAGQLAKMYGATTIGSAGGAEKVKYLTDELGFDAAFDYKAGDIYGQLKAAAPNGITLYFDNVGGEQLEAALTAFRPFGRTVVCGMISQYNDPKPGPRNLPFIISKRLTIRGFIILDHWDRLAEFEREVVPLVAAGKITMQESFVDGVENAPQAFMDMLRGGKHGGKVIVRLAPEGTAP